MLRNGSRFIPILSAVLAFLPRVVCAQGAETVLVKGGSFRMGYDMGAANERPAHDVLVSDFHIMKHEVTQKDYAGLLGVNPGENHGTGEDRPVYWVSWYDAVAYANRLSLRDGLKPCYAVHGAEVSCDWDADGWRLPTEAEWEYAARGGSLSKGYAYSGSDDPHPVAWYSATTDDRSAQPVGTKAANELGLHDMSGNVYEWCWDLEGGYGPGLLSNPRGAASGSRRAIRGGCWVSDASDLRPAWRFYRSPDGSIYFLGFRLVRRGPSGPRGSIVVESRGAGTLFMDGTRLGDVKAGASRLDDVAAGDRVLEMRYPDGKTESVGASPAEGGTVVVSFLHAVVSGPDPAARPPRDEVLVKGGTFRMGYEKGESDRPTYEVRVSDFFIMKHEMTQKEYSDLMGVNPSKNYGVGETHPVYWVSWYDAVACANRLSLRDGLKPCYTIDGTDVSCDWTAGGWRLPTEAEWEYAARGGSLSKGYAYAGSDDLDSVAWYESNAGGMTRPVGTKAANELGLYDMSGNVFEWCWDRYGSYGQGKRSNPRGAATGSDRVFRGGGYAGYEDDVRVTTRYYGQPVGIGSSIGFRLTRSVAR